jgi:hypothetical protein
VVELFVCCAGIRQSLLRITIQDNLVATRKERKLKGALFFVSFFLLFATAVYFIPTPMFPGDLILNLVDASTLPQATLLSALINGITYGLVAWAIFAAVMRKIGANESKNSSETQVKNQSQVKSQGKRSRKPKRY